MRVDKIGQKFLYMKLTKAVCGALIGAILWYDKLTGVNCQQQTQTTVIFHLNNILTSHVDQWVLHNLMIQLKEEFKKEAHLSEEGGTIHDYLGMRIDSSMPGRVVFCMFDYLEDILVEAPNDLKPSNCKYPINGK